MNHTPDTELITAKTDAEAERDCLAMAVLFARQWKEGAPIGLHEGIDEILGTMPGQPDAPDVSLALHWGGSVSYPDGSDLAQKAVIDCRHALQGINIGMVVKGDDRIKVASLLDMEFRDPYAKCSTPGCGTTDDCDASDPALFAWARLEVAGTGDRPSWYCTPMCVSNALARAGDELAAADHRAELDGGL